MDLEDFNVDKKWLQRARAGETEAMVEVANQLAHESYEQSLKWLVKALLNYTDANFHDFTRHSKRLDKFPNEWDYDLFREATLFFEYGQEELLRRFAQIDALDIWEGHYAYPVWIMFEVSRTTNSKWASEEIGETAFAKYEIIRSEFRETLENQAGQNGELVSAQISDLYSKLLEQCEFAEKCLMPNQLNLDLDFDDLLTVMFEEMIEVSKAMQDENRVEIFSLKLGEHLSLVASTFPNSHGEQAIFSLVYQSLGDEFRGESRILQACNDWSIAHKEEIFNQNNFNPFALCISESYLQFDHYVEGLHWFIKSRNKCHKNFETLISQIELSKDIIEKLEYTYLYLVPTLPCRCVTKKKPCSQYSVDFSGPFAE